MPSPAKPFLVLIGSSLITLFIATGCQPSTELTLYREGLYQVDEPLYEAHLLLMDDAVKANLRGDSDRQVVQLGITTARALYQQSKAADAASDALPVPMTVPTTAPAPAR